MSIRNISYTVSAAGISPSNSVFGGTQRDDNPTKVDFHIDGALKNALISEAEEKGGTVYYRFDVYDGDGNIIRIESTELGNKSTVSLPLTENITRYGGRITIYVVFTIVSVDETGKDKTELNLFSFPAHLSLNNLPNAYIEGDHNARESLTTLEEAAKRAAANALLSETNSKASENSVRSDRERVETAKASFENATWVFDGNGGRDEEDPEIDIHYAVDDTLSPASTNALQNRAIYNALEAYKSQILAQAKLDAHPIHSLYYCMDQTMTEAQANNPSFEKHPHTLFGGTWERVKDRFILAAGTEFPINYYPIISNAVDGLKPVFVGARINGNYYNISVSPFSDDKKYVGDFGTISYQGVELAGCGLSWWYDSYGTHNAGDIEMSGLNRSTGNWIKIIPDEDVEIIMSDYSSYVITVEDFEKYVNDGVVLNAQTLWTGKGGTSKHSLDINEMPKHDHLTPTSSGEGTGIHEVPLTGYAGVDWILRDDSDSDPTSETGGNQPHNNMPPYEISYCWRRTA